MKLERIVLGTAGLGGVWGSVDPVESEQTILYALESGITAIDTAPAYGDAELYVGKALKQWKGSLPTISTKVGRGKGFGVSEGNFDFSEAGMLRSIQKSLQTLGVEKLDILFLHDPKHMEENQAEQAVKTMQSFKEKGYTSKIGLGGNPPAFFDQYIGSGVFDVLMEFNKLNACNLSALDEYLPFCNLHQIKYYAASPLYMGLLGDNLKEFTTHRPEWISPETIQTAKGIEQIAKTFAISPDTLAHRFLLSLPYVFDIVIGASNHIQLKRTLSAFEQGPLPVSLQETLRMNLNKKKYLNA